MLEGKLDYRDGLVFFCQNWPVTAAGVIDGKVV